MGEGTRGLIAWIVVGLIGLLSLGSCDSNGTPVRTIRWEPDGQRFIQFYTNDEENLNYVFWSARNVGQDLAAGAVEITIKKLSGDPSWGFGMIFDYQDEENFGRVLITRNGSYQVARKETGNYTYLQNFTSSSAVETAPGTENVIRVSYTNPNLSVVINGTPVFTGNYGTLLGGTAAGAIAGVSPQELFPEVPVDVRYKMNLPVSYP
jgi:hypothetical protein